MIIDKAIREVVEAGYSVRFKLSKSDDGAINFTYTLLCSDGCGYGRGIKIRDYEDPECEILSGGPLDILGDSLRKTLALVPDLEAKKETHMKAVETEVFAA